MKVDAARFTICQQAFKSFKTLFFALFQLYLLDNKNLHIFESGA